MPGWIVAVSDYCSQVPPSIPKTHHRSIAWRSSASSDHTHSVEVKGGYLERLPLAAVASGTVDHAEIWSFAGRDGESDGESGRPLGTPDEDSPRLTRRVFRADSPAPYA